ncbi:MAG: hypothetical protein WC308_00835 [archaeon]|jgi:ribosomal protein L31E
MAKEFKEKTITINLRRAFDKPDTKRAKAALWVTKQAIKKETRAKEILISNGVNEYLWSRGLFHNPRKITVKVVSDKDRVTAYLPEEKITKKDEKNEKGKAEVIRESSPEKIQEKLKEVIEKKKAESRETKKEQPLAPETKEKKSKTSE